MFVFSDLHDLVQFLLDNGADPLATGTAHFYLWWARQWRSYPEKNMISNTSPSRGGFGAGDDIFPLMAAAATVSDPNEKTFDALLSAGADVNQRTAIGQTALHMLCATDYYDSIYGFYQALLITEYKFCKTASIKTLIRLGADVNACDNCGRSPLHYAALQVKMYAAELLLKNGANVHLKDKDGFTALDYAAAALNYKLTMALIDRYNFPMDKVIQAYESVALYTSSSAQYSLMKKATKMRKKHKIPKAVLPPLECYGFLKEN